MTVPRNILQCSKKTCLEQERCEKHYNSYKALVKQQNSRSLKRWAKHSLTEKEKKIYQKTGGKCWLCDRELSIAEFTKDHVIPKSLGGRGEIDNLMPAHQYCNSVKGSTIVRDSEEFLKRFRKHFKIAQ